MTPRPPITGQSRKLGTIAGLMLLAVLTAVFFVTPDGNNSVTAIINLAIFYALFARAVFSPVRIRSNMPSYASMEILFLIFYYAIFYLPYQYELLGLADLYRNNFVLKTYPEQTDRALIASSIGAVGFCTGIRIPSAKPTLVEDDNGGKPEPLIAVIRFQAVVLALQLGFMALYFGAGWKSADVGRYTRAATGGAAADGTYLLIVMMSLISIGLAVDAIAKRRKFHPILWLSVAATAVWAAQILFSGDRNNFFLLAIAAGGGLMTFRYRMPPFVLVASIAASLFLYNGVEAFRMMPEKSLDGFVEQLANGSGRDRNLATGSFSISTTTLKASMLIVPDVQDYGYGWYKLIGFSGIIPLVRGYVLSGYVGFLSTADLISYYMLGSNAVWGVGSNLISDIYIDFGIIGVALVMTGLGVSAGLIQKRTTERYNSTGQTVFYLVALPLIGELPRYSLDSPIRMLVWTAIILCVLGYLSIKPKPRRTRPQDTGKAAFKP